MIILNGKGKPDDKPYWEWNDRNYSKKAKEKKLHEIFK